VNYKSWEIPQKKEGGMTVNTRGVYLGEQKHPRAVEKTQPGEVIKKIIKGGRSELRRGERKGVVTPVRTSVRELQRVGEWGIGLTN